MTISELSFGIIIGLILLIFIVTCITVVVTKSSHKYINNIHNIYLGKLENSDASIQSAMKYLKLTNSITQYLNGEQNK